MRSTPKTVWNALQIQIHGLRCGNLGRKIRNRMKLAPKRTWIITG
jgi:hypothetical protein